MATKKSKEYGQLWYLLRLPRGFKHIDMNVILLSVLFVLYIALKSISFTSIKKKGEIIPCRKMVKIKLALMYPIV